MKKDMPPTEKTEVLKITLNILSNSISESGLEQLGKVENHYKKKKKAYTMELYKHNNKQHHYHHGV